MKLYSGLRTSVRIKGIESSQNCISSNRQVLASHRAALLEQMESSIDPPLTLHLACLVLFQAVTGNMLHASGKFVPHILAYLKTQMSADKFSLLHNYQGKLIEKVTEISLSIYIYTRVTSVLALSMH